MIVAVTSAHVGAVTAVASLIVAVLTFLYARRQAVNASRALSTEQSHRQQELNLLRLDVETAIKTHQLTTRSIVEVDVRYSSFDPDHDIVTTRFGVRCLGPVPLKDGKLFLQDANGNRLDNQSAALGSMMPGETRMVELDVGLLPGTYTVVVEHERGTGQIVEEPRGSYVMTDPYEDHLF